MNITTFNHEEFGTVEVLMVDDKPYFPATECAVLLGYRNTRDAIRRHCRGVVKHDGVSQTTNQHGVTTNQVVEKSYIPEGDLYRLIIRSKLPSAVRFESFVCDEILPSVRKFGAYITPATLSKMREDTAFAESLLDALAESEGRNVALMEYVDKLQPKARYFDNILQNPAGMPSQLLQKSSDFLWWRLINCSTAWVFNIVAVKRGCSIKSTQTKAIPLQTPYGTAKFTRCGHSAAGSLSTIFWNGTRFCQRRAANAGRY